MGIAATDLAWVAGLLEGEGSFSKKTQGSDRNIVAQCHMTDLDVLQKLQSIVGVGSVYGPYKNGKPGANWKPRYQWVVRGEKAYDLIKVIRPMMCARRAKRLTELITAYESVKTREFRIKHLQTGRVEKTTDLDKWLKDHDISSTGLWRTLSGQRQACKGWKRLS